MKQQLSIPTTLPTTIVMEIEFPCYKRYGAASLKFIDERKCIEVSDTTYDGGFSIRVYNRQHHSFGLILQKGITITEAEFENALQDVSEKIRTAIIESHTQPAAYVEAV